MCSSDLHLDVDALVREGREIARAARWLPEVHWEERLAEPLASLRAELGLRAGTPVAQGGVDAYLGMLGLGAVGAGDMAMIMGSSTCHLAQSEKGIFGSGLLGCYPDATTPGLYTLEGGQTATGSIVDWYRRHFAGNESAEAARTGRHVFEILDAQSAAVPPGSDGLVWIGRAHV